MQLFKSKSFIFLILVGCCIGVYWFIAKRSEFSELAIKKDNTHIKEDAKALVLAEAEGPRVFPSVDNKEATLSGFMGTPAETAEVKAWFSTHGELFGEVDSEYQSYPEQTLRELGSGGDIRALHQLAEISLDSDHFMREGYGFNAAEGYLWMAAIQGASKALADLALIHDARVFGSPNLSNSERRIAAIEVLARYDAASYRGNRYPNINDARVFKETYQIELSPEEQLMVKQKGKEIYESLQLKREELGLGAFDNSVPDSVKKFFESQEVIFEKND
ncbi:hypothetical protein [Cellvibrio sp. NN19]|uniref:hypothetical protein n=1 Tax=Cellvibrio chitinivorans TaxID=3102792 RepID=UPI002B410FC7|nr:hypothetical protein [Cellvibrio sp. NN19]